MQPITHLTDKFFVVTTVFNPRRYQSRYNLYRNFAQHMAASGAQLFTVELAMGERPHEVTEAGNPMHLQLRTHEELWHKENTINLGIQRLPQDWEYVAWVDADVLFTRPDWVSECVQLLQHYKVVQMYSEAQDLSPDYQSLVQRKSFFYTFLETGKLPPNRNGAYPYDSRKPWASGLAWAARRDAIDALGGLMDWAICGAADWHMAHALVGAVDRSIPKGMSRHYRAWMKEWEKRAEMHIRRKIGYMPGLILHNWHGKKKDRRYQSRWRVLQDNQFDPAYDLKRDWQGLWQLEQARTPRLQKLRDDLRKYLSARNEDSIDVQ